MANEPLQRYLLALTLSQGGTPNPELIEEAGKLSPEKADRRLRGFMQVAKDSGRHDLVMSYCDLIPAGDLVEIAKGITNRAKK